MRNIEPDLFYTTEHEWVSVDDDEQVVTVGITDYAQAQLGDVTFVEFPEIGNEVQVGDAVCTVESVKTSQPIYAPLSGKVIAINEDLVDDPELINSDPYDGGWFFRLEFDDDAGDQLSQLLSADDYEKHLDEIEEAEKDDGELTKPKHAAVDDGEDADLPGNDDDLELILTDDEETADDETADKETADEESAEDAEPQPAPKKTAKPRAKKTAKKAAKPAPQKSPKKSSPKSSKKK